jgi:hypothetical protein
LPQVQQGKGSGSDSPKLRLPPPLHLSLPRSVSYQSQASSTLSPASPPLFEDEEVDEDGHGEQLRKREVMADGHRDPGVGMPSDSMVSSLSVR